MDSFQTEYKKKIESKLDNFVKEGYAEAKLLYDGKVMQEKQ